MQKNSQNFSMEEAKRLANSETGQQLLAYLQQSNGEKLNKAMQSAAEGDPQRLKEALSSLMESPQVRELMKKLGG